MEINTDPQKIKEVLTRGVAEVIDHKHLEARMAKGEKLRVKLGIDPTSPNIHLGRSIPLLKLRDFQELGHQVVFIIGDFTGLIGDTSDKTAERPMLAKKTVESNMKTYLDQAGKILDTKKFEFHYNSEWLGKLNYLEIGEQADLFSVAEFIARENIKKRLSDNKRVSLREMLYPLMQGYDSVAIKADVELGGTDQRFNLLAGRKMQEYFGQKPQDILMNELIAGLDGRKMSSSWGNVINITDPPEEMYGKIMSMHDNLILPYFIHCTRVSLDRVETIKKELKTGKNPKEAKEELAFEITKMYWQEKGAQKGERHFQLVFKDKKIPDQIPEVFAAASQLNILDLLVQAKLCASKSEARDMVEQGAVKIDQIVARDWQMIISGLNNKVVQVGKRKFCRVRIKR